MLFRVLFIAVATWLWWVLVVPLFAPTPYDDESTRAMITVMRGLMHLAFIVPAIFIGFMCDEMLGRILPKKWVPESVPLRGFKDGEQTVDAMLLYDDRGVPSEIYVQKVKGEGYEPNRIAATDLTIVEIKDGVSELLIYRQKPAIGLLHLFGHFGEKERYQLRVREDRYID